MTSDKKVRFVVISFPGLSTNPRNVYDFVKGHWNLKKIVVDMGYKVEIFTRHEILHEDKIEKITFYTPEERAVTANNKEKNYP
ncbi:unnamed protein product [Rhizopus stolonifer]